MPPSLSIIIVTWNVEQFIPQCLTSLTLQSFNNYEIIVIDNGSTDNTTAIVKGHLQIKLIENQKNEGFAKANNQGIRLAKGDYILCLNSDVILEKDCLALLMQYAVSSSPSEGIIAPKILNPDQTIYSSGIFLTKALRFKSETSNKPNKSILWGANAAACLYKKTFLETIKIQDEYFDNDFFFLVEDVDLAYRAQHFNFKTIYLSNAISYHFGNCSNFPQKYHQYLSFRNRYYLLIKNLTFLFFLKRVHYVLIYDFARAVYLLFTNKYLPKAIKEIILNFPKMYYKRQQILNKHKFIR